MNCYLANKEKLPTPIPNLHLQYFGLFPLRTGELRYSHAPRELTIQLPIITQL